MKKILAILLLVIVFTLSGCEEEKVDKEEIKWSYEKIDNRCYLLGRNSAGYRGYGYMARTDDELCNIEDDTNE